MAQLLAMMETMRQQNEALQDSVQTLQQQTQVEDEQEEEELEPQPLSHEIWDDQVPKNFKPPSLVSYDGKTDPQEHVIAVNNQMAIVTPSDSLKCKLIAGTFKDVALRWYMSLPRFSITSYQDLTKKLIHHFSARKRRRVSTTTLFGVRQKQSESLHEYLARFNDETLKVSHPNQELFVGAFQNGLRAGQFNESLA